MRFERFAQAPLIGLIQGNSPNPVANTPAKGGGIDTAERTAPAPQTAP